MQAGGRKEFVSAADASETVQADPPTAPVALLRGRALACLALQTAAYSLLTLWALELLPISGAAWLSSLSLPATYVLIGVLGSAFFAPWLHSEESQAGGVLHETGRLLFAALYQAIVLMFFLRLAGRLAPLAADAAWETGAWMFQTALALGALARVYPRAFSGIAFGWIVGLPVLAYMLAELTLVGAGGVAWQQQTRVEATQSVGLLVRGMLQVSPFTAMLGALHGILPDGSPGLFAWPMGVLAGVNAGLVWVGRSQKPEVGWGGSRNARGFL